MSPIIKKIIENQADTFEKLVLCLVYTDREFYDTYCRYLCKAITLPQRMGEGRGLDMDNTVAFIDDFDIPEHNALFHVMDTYYQQIGVSKLKTKPISPDIFKILLKNCAIEADKGVNENELETVSEMMEEIVELQDNKMLLEQVEEGFPYWFKRQRIARLTNQVGLRDDWDPDELQIELTHFNRVLNAETTQIKTQSFGEGVAQIHKHVDRLPTGIRSLDAVLGGGIAKKEHMLVIAPSGCGKTVFASQVGSCLSLAKQRGIIIYTEQDIEALELRIFSARCGIPFKLLRDGLETDKLTQEQADRVERMKGELKGRLLFREWDSAANSRNFAEELRAIYEETVEEHGEIDFIMFDWLGGALTNDIANNLNAVRFIYQLAADFLAYFAKEMDLAIVSFAQAHPAQAANKIKVDASTISECKTMGNKASYVMGITALHADEDSPEPYADDQWFYFSKGRKIKNMKIPITRKFDFQKFEDRGRGQ